MSSMFVKPREGLRVRDPRTLAHLPETGARVPKDAYWLRRLKAGDVVEGRPPKTKAAKE